MSAEYRAPPQHGSHSQQQLSSPRAQYGRTTEYGRAWRVATRCRRRRRCRQLPLALFMGPGAAIAKDLDVVF